MKRALWQETLTFKRFWVQIPAIVNANYSSFGHIYVVNYLCFNNKVYRNKLPFAFQIIVMKGGLIEKMLHDIIYTHYTDNNLINLKYCMRRGRLGEGLNKWDGNKSGRGTASNIDKDVMLIEILQRLVQHC